MGMRQRHVARDGDPCIGLLNEFDVWKLLHHRHTVVGGAVVNHDDFEPSVVLRENRTQGLLNKPAAVEARDQDGNERAAHPRTADASATLRGKRPPSLGPNLTADEPVWTGRRRKSSLPIEPRRRSALSRVHCTLRCATRHPITSADGNRRRRSRIQTHLRRHPG